MKNLYILIGGLIGVGAQQINRAFNNSTDYLRGNYAVKKQERLEKLQDERIRQGLIDDYGALFPDSVGKTPSNPFREDPLFSGEFLSGSSF